MREQELKIGEEWGTPASSRQIPFITDKCLILSTTGLGIHFKVLSSVKNDIDFPPYAQLAIQLLQKGENNLQWI